LRRAGGISYERTLARKHVAQRAGMSPDEDLPGKPHLIQRRTCAGAPLMREFDPFSSKCLHDRLTRSSACTREPRALRPVLEHAHPFTLLAHPLEENVNVPLSGEALEQVKDEEAWAFSVRSHHECIGLEGLSEYDDESMMRATSVCGTQHPLDL
jgi:hypothetical protein